MYIGVLYCCSVSMLYVCIVCGCGVSRYVGTGVGGGVLGVVSLPMVGALNTNSLDTFSGALLPSGLQN